MRSTKITAGITTAALALAAFGSAAQAQTPSDASGAASGPQISIKNCTVKQSRNAGGFVWASCTISVTNLASADSPAVRFRSSLKPFNPGTMGPWRKQTGTVELGSITGIKFAYKGKTISQVRKSLKVTLSNPVDGTITDGTAVAKS